MCFKYISNRRKQLGLRKTLLSGVFNGPSIYSMNSLLRFYQARGTDTGVSRTDPRPPPACPGLTAGETNHVIYYLIRGSRSPH